MKKHFRKILSGSLAAMLLAAAVICINLAPASALTVGNPASHAIKLDYNPGSSVDNDWYYSDTFGDNPKIVTHINSDGRLTICVEPDNNDSEYPYVYIYELNADFTVAKTHKIAKAMPRFGSFTKDDTGYYIFTVKTIENESDSAVKNMSLNKYDFDGKMIKSVQFNGAVNGDLPNVFLGIKNPIDFGNCRMAIAGSKVAVYFSRLMYMAPDDGLNHQASYGFVCDKSTLSLQKTTMPYSSHSFDEFLLVDGNNFVVVDRGDAYPRGFQIQKIGSSTKIVPFKFKGEIGDNETYSALGGLVKTASGYLLAGTYENTTSSLNSSARNLFVQTISSGLNSSGSPIYLTNFNDDTVNSVGYPKIEKIGTGKNLLMWEQFSDYSYNGTYCMIVSDTGSVLKAATRLPDVRLNGDDIIRYNSVTGKINWTSNIDNTLMVYEFDPNSAPAAGTGVANVTVKATDGTTLSGAKITLDSTGEAFTVENDVHSMELPYGLHSVTVEKEGYQTQKTQINVYAAAADQTITLVGGYINICIKDSETGAGVAGVTVRTSDGTIVPPNSSTSSYYSLKSKPAGIYTLTLEKKGYRATTYTVNASFNSPGSYWVVTMYPAGDYTVTYDANGGANPPAPQNNTYAITNERPEELKYCRIIYNDNLGENSGTHEDSFYCPFNGWNTKADGSGKSYAPGSEYLAGISATLYAQWKPATVKYVGFPADTEHYKFLGWYDEPVGGKEVILETEMELTSDITVYAHWQATEHTISAAAGTGGEVLGAGMYDYDSFVMLNAVADEGCVFDGWYENGVKLEGIGAHYAFIVSGNRSLEARFRPIEFTVSGITVSGIKTVGRPLTFTANVAAKDGAAPLKYAFYILADGSVYYRNTNPASNTFTYTFSKAGTYTVVAYCTDANSKTVHCTQTVTIAAN